MIAARNPGLVLLSRLSWLVCLGLLLALWMPPSTLAAASGPAPATFLSNLEDVPLMPGLTERKDLAGSFDKPEGRIVEAYAEGRLSAGAVTKFYAATLPQLGWRPQGNNRFAREGEELLLLFKPTGTKLTVQFSLSPGS